MARAVFIARHTFGFAAGILLIAAAMFFLPDNRPTNQEAVASALLAVLIILGALMEAALFSLGCAWGGVQRLPKPGWAFVAGIATGVGFVAYRALMNTFPESTDLESHKQQGLYAMLGTAFIFLAPIISGLLCALIWKRAR